MQLLQLCRLVPDQAERDGDTVHPEPHQARGQALGIPHLAQHCLLRVACGLPRFSVGLSPARRHPRGAERGGQSAAAKGSGGCLVRSWVVGGRRSSTRVVSHLKLNQVLNFYLSVF